ncbi:UDP-N-acetylmuramate dehydrogenase [Candidatus Nomurabacteria bacterium]|nr:UDP-N-acetylmuramate dehydrogenase [Candidatus Nomurabacteria bacterium]
MGLLIEKNVSLAEHTTLKVGGAADYLVEVRTVEELVEGLRFAQQTATLPLIIGSGSNILVSDAGYHGLVIKNLITGVIYDTSDQDKVLLTCGAGEQLDTVIADTVARGYWGLENLSAIPGTIGATPIQNVGAYGVEVSSLITSVEAVQADTLEVKKFTNAECQFGYRDSFFKTPLGKKWAVTKVTFNLSKKISPQLEYKDLISLKEIKNISSMQIRNEVINIRSKKFPDWHRVGTAGSFFKNPIIKNEVYEKLKVEWPDLPGYPASETETKVALGWVLDKVCNLKGFCRDGVCLYEQQALVLVNIGSQSAEAIIKFENFVIDEVNKKTGIAIEPEVLHV